jgi:hypothetical protein
MGGGESGDTDIHTTRLKLASYKKGLKSWNDTKFGIADRELKKKTQQLADL